MLQKVISYLIILPLFIVPLFCCCHQEAMAATVGVEHCPDDEDASSATHHDPKSDHDHACNCGHELSATVENFTASHAVLSFVPNFPPETTFVRPVSVILLKGSTHLAYLGPPGRVSEVPLYIQQHSLRI